MPSSGFAKMDIAGEYLTIRISWVEQKTVLARKPSKAAKGLKKESAHHDPLRLTGSS